MRPQKIITPPRHPRLGSLPAARVLAVLAPMLGGCMSEGQCSSSNDCAAGLVCTHWNGGSERTTFCAKQCPLEQDRCDTGEFCVCPDSPLKQRCFNDAGERIAVCQP